MKRKTNWQWMAVAAIGMLLSITTGCKPSSVVSGRVICDGATLQKGSILFQPADGHGPSVGGPIADGQYQLVVEPGVKKVQILGVKTLQYDMNNPGEAALANGAAQRGDKSGTYDCADPTIADAEGNRATVDIKPGSQSVDFTLKRTS